MTSLQRYKKRLCAGALALCLSLGVTGKAAAAPAFTVSPLFSTCYTADNAAFYLAPEASGQPAAVVGAGFPVPVRGITSNGFYVAEMGGVTYYLPPEALNLQPEAGAGANDQPAVTTAPGANAAPLIAVGERSVTASGPEEAAALAEQALNDRVIDLSISISPALCEKAYHAVYDHLNALTAAPLAGYNLADVRSMDVAYTTAGGYVKVSFHYGSAGKDAEVESVVHAKAAEFAVLPSDYEKIKAVHDFLCGSVDYVLDEYYSHTAYGALVTRWAVCDGYALAFQRFMDVLGIPCYIALGQRSGEPHAWNLVSLGGQWYHLDATWDDRRKGVSRDYFLISGKTAGYSSWGGITLASRDYTP